MTAAIPVREIQEETKCPICLEYLTDPVTLHCGHNFCRGCITQYCEKWAQEDYDSLCCPSCRALIRKGTLRNNYQLANIVEKLKQVRFKPGDGNVCERHGKALDLFCEEDGEAVCVVCWRSPEHRSHPVLLLDEAAQTHREKFQAHLKTLREEREKLLGWKATGEGRSHQSNWAKESERLLRQTDVERQLVRWECERLRQFLAERERLLLARLQELDEEIGRRREEQAACLGEEISQLSALISELEEKCRQLALELLQGVRSAVSRGEEVMSPYLVPKCLELERRIWDFPGENSLQGAVTGFLEVLAAERGLRRARGFAVDVTLDPDTAHPNLVLSEDRKRVRHGDTRQDLPDNPERFDPCICVLGAEGFTGGKCYWEVEVADKPKWDLGVCRESVSRKGEFTYTPEDGYWLVWLRDGGYEALTWPLTPLSVSTRPSRVGVFLDYEAGEVSFYNVTDRSHLFTFTDTFSGTLRPCFSPYLNAEDTNMAPLTIHPVPAQVRGNLNP